MKALFIKAKNGMSIEEVCRIARAQAERMGLGARRSLSVPEVAYLPRCGGFAVVVQAPEGGCGRKGATMENAQME